MPRTAKTVSAKTADDRHVGPAVATAESASSDFVHREIVLLAILVAIAVAAFVVTRRFAAANEAMRVRDAETWYAAGQQALERRDVDAAVTALRRATARNPGAVTYRLALAQALTDAQQDDAARQLLLGLREAQPEDSETNLRLARLERRRADTVAASRYYEAAILGLWKAEQRPAQHQVRTEFIQFLLSHGERDRALSELLVVEGSLGENDAPHLQAAEMFLQAGDPARALTHFERALKANPGSQPALAGAGEAAFALGDYEGAHRYLQSLAADTDRTKELRTLTDLVIAGDPLAPRLTPAERSRRVQSALSRTIDRVDGCRARTPSGSAEPELAAVLEDARPFMNTLVGKGGAFTHDQIETTFDVVVRGERLAERVCGSPDPLDRALLLIASRHRLGEP
jgi:tetratricopeptide (TPR) repeat protein